MVQDDSQIVSIDSQIVPHNYQIVKDDYQMTRDDYPPIMIDSEIVPNEFTEELQIKITSWC